MTGQYLFRTARAGDEASIAVLMLQVWLHTYALAGITGAIARYVLAEFSPGKIAADIQSTAKQCFVVELDAHIIGVALLDMTSNCPITGETLPELDRLYVQEHFVGKGLGSSLLQLALNYCTSQGMSKLWLTVNSKNDKAQAFYAGHGFEKVGVTDFILEDERHENHVLHKTIARQ